LLATTPGRFFDALWLVKGNGTRTTSPKSKGIVDVVFGIAPDGGESRRARGSGGAGQRPLPLAQANEIDKILDLGDALGGQASIFSIGDLLSAGISVRSVRRLVAFYQPATRLPIPPPV
jgi:hypothetical protein